MSSTTKTSKGLSLWACLITALLISLNVMEAESGRCYWCGPLADDVGSSRRASQCSATGNSIVDCRETDPHCAFVVSGFPYKESRTCASIYQDECYTAYCNSSRTWRVTCPCRGDLCNGQKSAREIEAFKWTPAQLARNRYRHEADDPARNRYRHEADDPARNRYRREADDPAPAGEPAPVSPADDPAPAAEPAPASPADDPAPAGEPAPASPADDPAPPSPAADNTLASPTLDTLTDDQTKQAILTTTDSPSTLIVPAINSENNVPIDDYLSDQPNNPEQQSLDNHADDNTIRASNIVSPVETKTEVTTETRMEHEKSETTTAFAGMATTAENQVKLEAKKGSPTAEALQHDQAPEGPANAPTMAATVAELTTSQKMLDIASTNTTSTEPNKNMAPMPLGHTKHHLLIMAKLLVVTFFII